MTIIAIYVLTELFSEQEDEWTLLVRKAKTYLKSQGISNPEKLIDQISLQLV